MQDWLREFSLRPKLHPYPFTMERVGIGEENIIVRLII
jgi:hypothetical protein